jgi:hypothetical protein
MINQRLKLILSQSRKHHSWLIAHYEFKAAESFEAMIREIELRLMERQKESPRNSEALLTGKK